MVNGAMPLSFDLFTVLMSLRKQLEGFDFTAQTTRP
jgi:hypothetical protein